MEVSQFKKTPRRKPLFVATVLAGAQKRCGHWWCGFLLMGHPHSALVPDVYSGDHESSSRHQVEAPVTLSTSGDPGAPRTSMRRFQQAGEGTGHWVLSHGHPRHRMQVSRPLGLAAEQAEGRLRVCTASAVWVLPQVKAPGRASRRSGARCRSPSCPGLVRAFEVSSCSVSDVGPQELGVDSGVARVLSTGSNQTSVLVNVLAGVGQM